MTLCWSVLRPRLPALQAPVGRHGLYSGEVFLGIPADGRLNFKTNPDTLPDYPACNDEAIAPSEKQILKNYREVHVDIPEDAVQLAALTRKVARP